MDIEKYLDAVTEPSRKYSRLELVGFIQGYYNKMEMERRGLYVTRSTFQEVVEENKKLLREIQILVHTTSESFPNPTCELIRKEIESKYKDRFTNEKEFKRFMYETMRSLDAEKDQITLPLTTSIAGTKEKPTPPQSKATQYEYDQISIPDSSPLFLPTLLNSKNKEGWEFVQFLPIRSAAIFKKQI